VSGRAAAEIRWRMRGSPDWPEPWYEGVAQTRTAEGWYGGVTLYCGHRHPDGASAKRCAAKAMQARTTPCTVQDALFDLAECVS